MLSGFECDDDQTGWLAGLAVWTVGAAAGCLLAVATNEPSLPHWQVLALAVAVSLVSLGLRLPVMLSHCPGRIWLVHSVWMLAFFSQINWAGFLAARSSSITIAAEAILICLGLEAWLLAMFVSRGRLPWIQQLFSGSSDVAVNRAEKECYAVDQPEIKLEQQIGKYDKSPTTDDEVSGEVRREYVDAIDENGQRYLSGTVLVQFAPQQRTETFVLSFCPALEAIAEVELECDSEEVTAKVEHATETGARILVRRTSVTEALSCAVDWYAIASQEKHHSVQLP